MQITVVEIKNILTRTSGFLKTVSSHSMQPYQGCSFGNTLCGVGCYVQHNGLLTRGRPWGQFLQVRTNAAEVYRRTVARERAWARQARGRFGVFMSSSTEPFLPQERRYGVSRDLLRAMCVAPPDLLIVQSHSHRAAEHLGVLRELHRRCELRVHLSIETDRESIPGLPPHASSVAARLAAAGTLKEAGIQTVVTVSPLLPIADPEAFFARIAQCADAVVIDHFIQGDGTADGARTARTELPATMAAVDGRSVSIDYRQQMVAVAQRHLPGRVGVSIDGFAGRYAS